MKPLNFMLAMLLLALLVPFASASVAATIDMKTLFEASEKVYFNYTLASNANAEVTYAISIACPDAPMPLIVPKTASIAAGIPFEGTYVYMESLDESIEPQQCTAILNVTAPEASSASASFELRTKPSFEFALKICKDSACKDRAMVFDVGETAYIQYDSSVAGLDVSAVITQPDLAVQNIALPAEVLLDKLGNYSLEVTASKSGYKDAKRSLLFGTIGAAAEAPAVTREPPITISPEAIAAIAVMVVALLATALYFLRLKKR